MKIVRVFFSYVILYSLFFFISSSLSLFAQNNERIDLIVSSINESSLSSLIEKSAFLDLPLSKERDELIKNLFEYYGFTPIEKEEIELNEYLTILKSDSFYINETRETIILAGNVSIIFEGNLLSADDIIYNDTLGYLNAIGNVVFEQDKDEEVEVIKGASLTFNIHSNEIVLESGELRSSNIDEEGNVTNFLSRGENMLISSEPFLISVIDSSVTTSVDNEYYQIKSKNFYVHEGNDLFLSSSFLYIGRVPILYLPFFFYPGKTLIFNPSFGYDSVTGLSVNTSYELYGKNPLIHEQDEEGISSFFSGEQKLEKNNSNTYSSSTNLHPSKLEKWAIDSSSYGTIYADSYQKNGIFLGYEGVHNLFKKSLNASLLAGIAYKNPSNLVNNALFRYIITPNITYKKNSTSLSFSMPLYSDPDVSKEYLQRDIRSRLLELASINTKTENEISTINNYTWSFKGSTSFAPEIFTPYINSININRFNSDIRFEKHYDSSIGGYIIDNITPIDVSAKMSGTLVDIKWIGKSKESTNEIATLSNENSSLLSLYQLALPTTNSHANKKNPLESYVRLNYEIKQDVKEVYDYKNGEQVDIITTNNNTSFITLDSRIGPHIITFNHTLKSLIANNTTSNKESKQYELSSDNTITLPFANISYTLNQLLYRDSYQKIDAVVEINRGFTDFSGDYVKTHTLSYRPSYTIKEVTLIPSVTFQLPPLEQTITPKLTLNYKAISSSFSLGINEDDSQKLDIFRGAFSFSYKGDVVSFSNVALYSKSDVLTPFYKKVTIDTSISIDAFNSFLLISGKSTFDTSTSSFKQISSSFSLPFIDISLKGAQVDSKIKVESLDVKLINSLEKKLWWKNRISLSYDVNAFYHHSFVDSFGSYASIDVSLSFNIYKFLSIKATATSVNRGLYRYDDFQDAFRDLLASFDFFKDGRYSTQFVMDAFSLSLIHYMDDWDLYVTYEASMKSDNNRLIWSPVLKILVKWKAIGEIKVDREVNL